ncbi:hypothetical protein GWI33_018254 [Rhynchophorus ferrugineus]|uniref:Uncharacterized protein n=1 Tax=Rhynchophorus ferrugineus TaxID=354439 RepID=A0A834M1P3_RHYFE|nr:hypothetical protein GWI33_018254 [Rhynchophorus ferrugineus]
MEINARRSCIETTFYGASTKIFLFRHWTDDAEDHRDANNGPEEKPGKQWRGKRKTENNQFGRKTAGLHYLFFVIHFPRFFLSLPAAFSVKSLFRS